MELTVIARSKAKAGKEKEVEAALRKVVGPTHGEVGCLRYAIHRGVEDPARFLVVERWVSKEALDAHLQSAHVQALFATVIPLLAEPADITAYELIPEGTGKGKF